MVHVRSCGFTSWDLHACGRVVLQLQSPLPPTRVHVCVKDPYLQSGEGPMLPSVSLAIWKGSMSLLVILRQCRRGWGQRTVQANLPPSRTHAQPEPQGSGVGCTHLSPAEAMDSAASENKLMMIIVIASARWWQPQTEAQERASSSAMKVGKETYRLVTPCKETHANTSPISRAHYITLASRFPPHPSPLSSPSS